MYGRQCNVRIGLKKNVEKAVRRGNVKKYVVHGEVVGGPSLPKQQWRGTRKTLLWKTGNNNDKRGVEVAFEKRTWIIPCFVQNVVSKYSGERLEMSVTERLAQTHWALVSAWPANATDSFLSAQFQICGYKSIVNTFYS